MSKSFDIFLKKYVKKVLTIFSRNATIKAEIIKKE